MAEYAPPRAPPGSGRAGRTLWHAVVDNFELDGHELALLQRAAFTADTCERLQAVVLAEGELLGGKAHPALVELRQQSVLLARLVVALRVPIGDETAVSNQGPPRLQRRGLRGVYLQQVAP